MHTRKLKINFNENSKRFGQNNGPSINFDSPQSDKSISNNDNMTEKHPKIIEWPYIARQGPLTGQLVFDIYYWGNAACHQEKVSDILTKDTPFQQQLTQHIMDNLDDTNKKDINMKEQIHSMMEHTGHDLFVGDIICASVNDECKYYVINLILKNDNTFDFSFKINKFNDIGLYFIDINKSDITNENDIMNSEPTIFMPHNMLDKIDLGLEPDASIRTKFGHLKYMVATQKNLEIQNEKEILEGRLESIGDQTLQTLGKGYYGKLNEKAKSHTLYSVSKYCGATAWVRILVPYFVKELKLNKNFDSKNKRNVCVPLTMKDMRKIFGGWAEHTNVGDISKGERSVKFFARNISMRYSFVTNVISLRFNVCKRSI